MVMPEKYDLGKFENIGIKPQTVDLHGIVGVDDSCK